MKQLKKTILTLVALLAVTTGAWADETLLVTIENTGDNASFKSGSKTFDDKVTVTFSNSVSNYGDAYGWYCGGSASLLTVTGINDYTITTCRFYTKKGLAVDGYNVEGESPSVYLSGAKVYTDDSKSVNIGEKGINKIEVYGTAPSTATGPEVAWDKAENTGSFTMPGGNVTLEPEYYPQATVDDGGVTASDADARATTDDPLVKVDATKLTGAKKLMYFVSNSGTTAPAYDAEGWTDQLPNAEKFNEAGIVYVWYYPVGTDEGVDGATATYSDGDICLQSITARIAAAPTYAVTFAEGTDLNEWTADPNAGVTKGQQVTVTYTGSKKVIGVKVEKKGVTTSTQLSAVTTSDIGKVVCAAGHLHDAKTAVPDGCTAVGILGKVTETGHGLILALQDAAQQTWNTINGWTSVNTYASTTLKVLPDDAARSSLTSYTTLGETAVSNWAVAQKSDYEAIFTNLGSTTGDEDGMTFDDNVNAYITGVGGTALETGSRAWSISTYNDTRAWQFTDTFWGYGKFDLVRNVRPVLGFGEEATPGEAANTWTFAMPGSDVELTPIYAPDAQFAIENAGTVNEKVLVPAPVEGTCAGSGEPIMTAGTTNEGTLYYTVTETDDIPAFSTTTWTTTLPTAEAFTTPCTVYGWAYIVGDDTHNDNGVFGPYAITLKRDLFDRVSAVLNNGSRVRLIMNEGKYQPIEPLTYTLTDISDAENPKTLVSGTDYTYGGLQRFEDGSFVDVTDESNLPPGIYRAQFNGMGDFAGWKPTDSMFELYYGYEVYVPAHEYVTYCSTEALTLEDENAALYTITAVSNSEATLSRALTVAPATTPLLVENNSDESRTILLIPTDKHADDVTPATEFIGVLTAERDLYKNNTFDFYAFNGLDFVLVNNLVTIPVGKCFIAIQTGNLSARSITIRRSATAIDATLMNNEEMNNEQWFDLNGRKVNKPTKKGIYIKNGQKVVIK